MSPRNHGAVQCSFLHVAVTVCVNLGSTCSEDGQSIACCVTTWRSWVFTTQRGASEVSLVLYRVWDVSRGPCWVRLVLQGGWAQRPAVVFWPLGHVLKTEKYQSFLISSFRVPVPGEWPFYPTSLCCDAPLQHRLNPRANQTVD